MQTLREAIQASLAKTRTLERSLLNIRATKIYTLQNQIIIHLFRYQLRRVESMEIMQRVVDLIPRAAQVIRIWEGSVTWIKWYLIRWKLPDWSMPMLKKESKSAELDLQNIFGNGFTNNNGLFECPKNPPKHGSFWSSIKIYWKAMKIRFQMVNEGMADDAELQQIKSAWDWHSGYVSEFQRQVRCNRCRNNARLTGHIPEGRWKTGKRKERPTFHQCRQAISEF